MVQANETKTSELVAQLKARNTEAFATLYDNYSAALFGITYSIVQNKTVAEDLLQDIFVKIWRHIDSYNPEKGRLFTWLLNIARNTCKDYLLSNQYRNQQQPSLDEQAHCEIGGLVYQDDTWSLQYLTERMEPKYGSIIHWVYILGYTQEETAEMLNIPLGTVKTRSRAALKQLRTLYGNHSVQTTGYSLKHNIQVA